MQNSQRQIFQHRIQLLQLQIEQQKKREQNLSHFNEIISDKLQCQRETQQENQRLIQLNQKLMQGLRQTKLRHSQQLKYYDEQIIKLKQELQDKTNELEKQRVQSRKKQLVHQQKIAMLQNIIQKKCQRVNTLQKKVHQEQIQKIKMCNQQNVSKNNERYQRVERLSERVNSQFGGSTLRVSQISNGFDSENNMRASNLSNLSKKSKNQDYMKYSKAQIKILMGAVLKTKKQIQRANNKCNREKQQSQYNKYLQRPNKTMLN